MTDSGDAQKELVYGEIYDALVFIPREPAEELAQLRGALRSSTWGELRAAVPPERLAQVEGRVEDETPAEDEDPFDPDAVAGCADGDWPEWPAQEMVGWVPRGRDRSSWAGQDQ